MGLFPFPSPMFLGAAGPPRKWRLLIDAVDIPGDWATIAEIQMRDTPGGVNKATGGTASASGVDGTNTAAKAFDGNNSTRWKSGNGTMPQWIEYDFASPIIIEEVTVRSSATAGEENDAPTHVYVQYEVSGVWKTYFEFYTNSDWPTSTTRTFTNGSTNTGVSQWRLNINSVNTGGSWASIAELAMHTSIGGSNVATGGAAQASAADWGVAASNAFDGNTGTQWQSATATMPQWLAYYFPTSRSIVEIAITASSHTDAPKSFDLQYWDGATWQTYKSWTTPATWTDGETRVFN